MKKGLSILFAGLILLTGMHLSVATHFCGGELASVKMSFTGEEATCGMEIPQSSCPVHKEVTPQSCCRNEVSNFAVDNYNPSSFQISQLLKKTIYPAAASFIALQHSQIYAFHSYTYISPPYRANSNAVKLPDICVFRI
jgi:hypothetical protein